MGLHLNSSRRALAIWATVAAFLGIAILQPSAYGLEFPATTSLTMPIPGVVEGQTGDVFLTSKLDPEIAPIEAALFSELSSSATVLASSMSLVSLASASVELARTPDGAREVAKVLMDDKYGWGEKQYVCLDDLWAKESHWNYKASNRRSGAHGIPQALPATKMEVIGTDWRTNPVTQISWGLRYIDIRYDTPCKAWAKFKRSNYY
ncbi:MAG: transglycosylase SLT domain-containing protein [Actinobacteria bacterium]|nr:transglycosylase SLT domain-containing protein [Actinomycetota bacterium]